MKWIVGFLCLILTLTFQAQKRSIGNLHLQHYLKDNGSSEEQIGFFLKGNSGLIKDYLKEHNGFYRGSIQGWHFVRLPSNKMLSLIQSDFVSEFDFHLYEGKAMNDTMRVNNRINAIHAGLPPLNLPYTGKGIVMGFIDTGIDWNHPDFMNPDSSTRILSIWDQTLGVNQYTPAKYGYGQHWDSVMINQDIPTNNDQWGHGSTVTGAAAGNAFANGKNKGVAPDSYIIMVESNFNAANWLSTVVDAVEYIYNFADSLGLPCSINASVGTYLGSHDGLDPYALYIDSLILSKRGHLFAASAGNAGDLGSYHLHHEVTPDTNYTFFQVNPSAYTGNAAIVFELWADTSDFNNVYFTMGADKVSPNHSFRGRANFINAQNNLNTTIYDTIKNDNGDVLASVEYWIQPRDGQYYIQVYMPTPDSSDYYYRLETYGTGRFDGWNSSSFGLSNMIEDPLSIPGFNDIAHYIAPDSLQTIVSSFQCSPNVVTVGNYSNDSGYVNSYGNWMDMALTRGELASTSSIGPSRTGIIKPELAASGHMTNSSLPLYHIANFYTNGIDSLLAFGGMHYRNGGTSMSSPVVAGVGALLLEKCPNITQADFIEALINNTYTDTFTGTVPNYAFGYGKLDGFNTVNNVHFSTDYTGDLSVCAGDSSLLTINFDNGEYFWQHGDTTQDSFLSSNLQTYYIVTDSAGCYSDTGFINMSELSLPNPSILISFDSLITLSNMNNYQWYFDGAVIPAASDSLYIALQNGDYFVEVTNNNGCIGISDTVTFNSVGIEESIQLFGIYPNPNKGSFQVTCLPNTLIEIFDILGKKYCSKTVSEAELLIEGLPAGTYVIKASYYNHFTTERMIVVR